MKMDYEAFGRHIAAILTGRSPHDAGLADEIIRAAKNAGIMTEREKPLQHGSTALFPTLEG